MTQNPQGVSRDEEPAQGWYPDPNDRWTMLWWDGRQWTGRKRKASLDELQAGPAHDMPAYTPRRSGDMVASGFKFGFGFFLFFFVALPILFLGGCAVLAGAAHDSLVVAPLW